MGFRDISSVILNDVTLPRNVILSPDLRETPVLGHLQAR